MSEPTPYNLEYFRRQGYERTMLEPREVNGHAAAPLAVTVGDMLECVRPRTQSRPPRVFDIGCAYGFVVREARLRGWEARGMDLSREVVLAGPVPDLLRIGDATREPIDDCDVAVCLNVFEHLTPDQAMRLGANARDHADVFLTVINKSDHDPTHVSLHPNRWWIELLGRVGLSYDPGSTYQCRAAYLRSGNWHERWWRDCLVFRSRPDKVRPVRPMLRFGTALSVAGRRRIAARHSERSDGLLDRAFEISPKALPSRTDNDRIAHSGATE